MPTRIVIYAHRPKRTPRKQAQAAPATVPPAVATAAPRRGRKAAAWVDDGKETPAEVKAFFARMIRPGGALPPETE